MALHMEALLIDAVWAMLNRKPSQTVHLRGSSTCYCQGDVRRNLRVGTKSGGAGCVRVVLNKLWPRVSMRVRLELKRLSA